MAKRLYKRPGWQSKFEVWDGDKLVACPVDRAAALRVLKWHPNALVFRRVKIVPYAPRTGAPHDK